MYKKARGSQELLLILCNELLLRSGPRAKYLLQEVNKDLAGMEPARSTTSSPLLKQAAPTAQSDPSSAWSVSTAITSSPPQSSSHPDLFDPLAVTASPPACPREIVIPGFIPTKKPALESTNGETLPAYTSPPTPSRAPSAPITPLMSSTPATPPRPELTGKPGRLQSLIEFAKETARLKANPVPSISSHGLFFRFEESLRALPGLHLNVGESEGEEIWLELERLTETYPPNPQSKLLATWINLSKNPRTEPTLKNQIDHRALVAISALPPAKFKEGETPPLVTFESFADRLAVLAQLKSYTSIVWAAWAAAEKERRKSIELYGELFQVSQIMQGSLIDSPLELVWGVGIASWNPADRPIRYPLMTQLVEISVNDSSMAVEIRPRSTLPRLELDIYAAQDNPGVVKLAETGKTFFHATNHVLSPFDASTFDGLLRSAAMSLDAHGTYWPTVAKSADDRAIPDAGEYLVVTDTWAIFTRPRTANLFVQDLERFEAHLEGAGLVLPDAVQALVSDPLSVTSEKPLAAFRGLSMVAGSGDSAGEGKPHELYFPMPYNDEQVQIIQMLEAHEGVVVQGPPGTGKTHTIANVICHYLAMGKRVLVTSMKDPALAVLQEKIPDDIRPLAISLLTSEAEGMKQFEFAINKIAAEVARIDKSAYRREIAQLDGEIDTLHAQITRVDREIGHWAAKNLSVIVLDDERVNPLEVARLVVACRGEADWLTDSLSIAAEHRPQFSDNDIVELRVARRAVGSDISYLGKKIPMLAEFPDAQKLLQVHQDLSRAEELKTKVERGDIPRLVTQSPAAIQSAMTLAARASNLRLKRLEVANATQNWTTSMLAYLRQHGASEMLRLFHALMEEIATTRVERHAFLQRPVTIPTDLDLDPDYVAAISNLAEGKRPFGLIGLVAKKEERKRLDSIQILAMAPQTAQDWAHVLEYLHWQQRARALLVRWNTLASELPLPTLAREPEKLSAAKATSDLYSTCVLVVGEEMQVAAGLSQLLPGWKRVEDLAFDPTVVVEAEDILNHHLTCYRLAETWAVKEQFQKTLVGCEGDITDRLRTFLNDRLGNPAVTDAELQAEWSGLMDTLHAILNLATPLLVIRRVTRAMESSGATKWAGRARREPCSGPVDEILPDNWGVIWRLRRLITHMDSIDGRHLLYGLSVRRTDLEGDLAKRYQTAVSRRTWLKLAENAHDDVRAALESYRAAIKKIGKGTGVRAGRYRQDARFAADKANSAIPCWIMPHYRVCESLPPSFGCFDLVIIDEASQSDLMALPAILRGKKLLVVGDEKQVSPEGVGLQEEKVRNLMSRFLSNQVEIYRAQMTPERSIYDLCKVVFAKSAVMLREHFRCVAPIIEYSKREYYNHELRPLRIPKASERMDPPLIDVYVQDGICSSAQNTNLPEAKFIVAEIARIVDTPALQDKSIGVVSLLGDKQALLVMRLLAEELGEEVVTRFKIACGDARTFQGKERDIMFLSMVAEPGAAALTRDTFAQRFNVAASRARDRMYLVRSLNLSDVKTTDERYKLISHFQSPFALDAVVVKDRRLLCDSDFEREVYDVLTEKGYRVVPQVPVGTFRIDMVVEGDNDLRLAVECDGDRFHGPAQWDHDMNRQRILERAGWRFWRCFASTFVMQREAVIAELVEALRSHGVEPASGDGPSHSIHVELREVVGLQVEADEVTL